MDWKLLFQAITKYLLGLALVALLLFLPAGTLHYPKGWLLLAILFGPMMPAGLPGYADDRKRVKYKVLPGIW
ncbi:MAG: hypothetical protein IJF88_09735 [Oscillospiraceae bacterium]|nr:hypothetical protein [Oscillospiraceae bacterium]